MAVEVCFLSFVSILGGAGGVELYIVWIVPSNPALQRRGGLASSSTTTAVPRGRVAKQWRDYLPRDYAVLLEPSASVYMSSSRALRGA